MAARLGQVLAGGLLCLGSSFGGARWDRYGGGWAALSIGSPRDGDASPGHPNSFTIS